jgi:hypothetical protein
MDVLPALAVRDNARLWELVPEKTKRESRLAVHRSRIFKMLSKRLRGNVHFKKFPQSPLGKEAGFFRQRRIFHAVRASDPSRCDSRPAHAGGADSRQKFRNPFEYPEGQRATRRLLPCLSAGG